ncbi:MAG: LPS-assembly protein LptD [Alphaproteobacteria bacterium]|nr:LPS-assembly protein LptD [Alphaproteobacteria bacterium]
MATLLRPLVVLLALLVVAAASPAPARAQQLQQFDANQEAVLTADELTYDNELGVVVARGNVEVTQGERTLLADTVTYNQRTNTVSASGNVSLIEPSGEVMFADYMELMDAMKEGVIRDIRVLLTDNSRLAANGARRTGGNRTEMSKGVFSACKPCEEDPSRAPLWQLKARRVVHDQEEQVIRYNDAWMEMFGVPVAYTPYFQHPDPTVKRQSGFLVPTHVYNSNLGFMSGVPYFWAIDKDKDVTLLPMYSTKKGPVGRMEYRQMFPTGSLLVDGSVARSDQGINQLFDTTDATTVEEDKLRGHVFGRGRWDVDDTWRTGFDVQRASDRTYLSLYKITNTDLYNQNVQTLTSNAYVEGFMGRSYASANAYAFQGLRSTDTQRTTPYVPVMWDYNYVSEAASHGGRFSLDANTMVLERNDGPDSRRASVIGGYQVPYYSPIGEVYRFSASVQADAYSVNNVRDPGRPDVEHNGETGRLFPQLGVQWSLPFVRQGEEYRQLIEPVLAGFVAPNGHNPASIANEDSVDVEFDDTRLFNPNRFTGTDRVDGGTRGIYGLKTGLYHSSGSYATTFFGQSYNLRTNEQFTEGSGLAGHRSDYVARVEMSPHPWFDVITRFRLDKDEFTIRRNETIAVVGPPILQLQGSYIRAPSTQFSNGQVQQAAGYLSSKIDQNWTVHVNGLRDLNEGNGLGWINYGAGALYQDECFIFDVRWLRTFTANQEVAAGDTIYFKLTFRLLGDLAGGFDAPKINGGNLFGSNQ